MSSRCPDRSGGLASALLGLLALVLVLGAHSAVAESTRELRVCADPDNPPFSSSDASGFENRIAQLLAADLHAQLRYTWLAQRRGFIRNTLDARFCDVVIGWPADAQGVLTTAAYYRAGYQFVYRSDRLTALGSFDDPRLREIAIGVPLVGNDMAATPPGQALARRGITANVIGYGVFGEGTASARMIDALAAGTIDIALLWGPQAGYYTRQSHGRYVMQPAIENDARAGVRSEFDMAFAVRKDDAALRNELERARQRLQPELERVLDSYGVPRSSGILDERARGPGMPVVAPAALPVPAVYSGGAR
jgi:mxaJ protein